MKSKFTRRYYFDAIMQEVVTAHAARAALKRFRFPAAFVYLGTFRNRHEACLFSNLIDLE